MNADPRCSGPPEAGSHRIRFRLEAFADINVGSGPEWLVADVLPATGLSVIYGESGSGKSFLASDMALAVALGLPWAGKDVQAGSVVYVTAEGASGFRKRVAAYRQHYRLNNVSVPFYVLADAPCLGHEDGDGEALVADIRAQIGDEVRMVVIDTLARTMHGADENSAAAMGSFVDACGTIGKKLGCTVVAIHHCAKGNGKAARGSSALRAAADCEIFVEGSQERRTATLSKQKDGEEGWNLPFKLMRVEIGDPDRELSSCVLKPLDDGEASGPPPQTRKLSDRQSLALKALTDLLIDGKPLPAAWQLPATLKGVPTDRWLEDLKKRGVIDREAANPRTDFRRLRNSLKNRGLIGEREDQVWKV